MSSTHQAWHLATNNVEYTIRLTTKAPMPSLPTVVQPCKLLVAIFGVVDSEPFEILCFHPHMADASLSESDYYHFHHQQLATALTRQFPFFLRACAETVSAHLTGLLRSANASHQCHGGALSPVHMVHVQVQPLSVSRVKPATKESVHELVLSKESAADESFEGVDCAICTEEIETRRSSLSMPCSHVFHQPCLVRWLHTNHVCPLCRYELPYKD